MNEIYRLRGIIEAQNAALNHWRKLADQDTGRIARYQNALNRIASGDREPVKLALIALDPSYEITEK